MNEPATPTVKAVDAVLVMVGAVPALTIRVKLWTSFGGLPFEAVNVSPYTPFVAAAGVPARVPVPLPLSMYVTPVGSAPDSPIEGVGTPAVVTVKEPATPTVKVVVDGLVMVGAVAALATPGRSAASMIMVTSAPPIRPARREAIPETGMPAPLRVAATQEVSGTCRPRHGW